MASDYTALRQVIDFNIYFLTFRRIWHVKSPYITFVKNHSCVTQIYITKSAAKCIIIIIIMIIIIIINFFIQMAFVTKWCFLEGLCKVKNPKLPTSKN